MAAGASSPNDAKDGTATLGFADVTASTVANIGPGVDFYFAFGVIAVTAGTAAPLTILAAGVAVFLLAFATAEFTKMEPSAGSFVTYVETSLGPKAGVVTALLVTVGFTVAIAGVFAMSGGMIALTLDHYTAWTPSWLPIALVMTAGAIWFAMRGRGLDGRYRRRDGPPGAGHGRGLRRRPYRPAWPSSGTLFARRISTTGWRGSPRVFRSRST